MDVLAWSVTRGRPGVIYANLGTVAAGVDLMDAWDPGLLRQDLTHLSPSLIVLAFGTNEGFRETTDPAAYATVFAARLRALHAAAPGAALLVLGPPDAYRHRRKGSSAPPACDDPNWTEPPNLAPIREAQRSIAAREGAYFWDWQAAMGGPCSMLRWAATEPADGRPGPRPPVRARLPGNRRCAVPRDHGRLRTLPRAASRRLMLFPTLDFLLFFIVVLAVMVPLAVTTEWRKLALVAASYFFYAQWNWHYCLLLAGSSLLTYAGGIAIGAASSQRTRKLIVGVTVAMHLLLLSTFKYLDFLVGSANHLLHALGAGRELPFMEIILPVGISFFTFHGISYLVDIYRGDVAVCRRPVDILLYLSFFPQLVAGPIVRAAFFLPQLAQPPAERVPLAEPVLLILGGLFKKVVIATYLATDLVDPVFFDPSRFGTTDLVLAAYGYAVQIYCDFSAYTDMAIGFAALLGYRFPINFDQPYRAQSLREFWQRWHISLSSWLRDYLYKPLGGSRGSRWFTTRNLMITMLLGGSGTARRGSSSPGAGCTVPAW